MWHVDYTVLFNFCYLSSVPTYLQYCTVYTQKFETFQFQWILYSIQLWQFDNWISIIYEFHSIPLLTTVETDHWNLNFSNIFSNSAEHLTLAYHICICLWIQQGKFVPNFAFFFSSLFNLNILAYTMSS